MSVAWVSETEKFKRDVELERAVRCELERGRCWLDRGGSARDDDDFDDEDEDGDFPFLVI